MTPDERQLLGGLFDRIRDSAQGQQRDAEAEAFINNAIKAQPYAPYMMAQAVIVQEETLKGAVQKIEELEARIKEMESRPAPAQAAPSGGFLGGLGRSMFGGGDTVRAAAPAAAAGAFAGAAASGFSRSGVPSTSGVTVPPPSGGGQYGGPQQYGQPMNAQPMNTQPMGQPGPWQQPQQQGGGSSFLKGALGAAAGVAGGMLLANAVSGMFRGDQSASGGHNKQVGHDSASSSLDKDSSWGNESKSGSAGDSWGSGTQGSQASNDQWDTPQTAGSGDNWDTPAASSNDQWDNSDTGDAGGDSWGDE